MQTGVRQGYILSPTMFLIVIDAVMRNVNQDGQRGIQRGLVNGLENLDFANVLGLLSETYGDMQTKLEDLTNKAGKTGFIINVKTTKALRINTSKTDTFTIRSKTTEDVDSFTYLGSMVAKDGQLRRMSHNEFKKQIVLSYNSIQCGRTAEYLLGLNSASSVVILSQCCYMDLRLRKK